MPFFALAQDFCVARHSSSSLTLLLCIVKSPTLVLALLVRTLEPSVPTFRIRFACSDARLERPNICGVCNKKMLSRVMDSAFFVLFLCDLRFAEVVDAVLEGFDFGFGIGLFFALVLNDFGFGIGYEFFVAELFHYRI